MDNNVELLRLLDMPVFSSTEELANIMHIENKTLNALVMRNSRFYKRYSILKKSGGTRNIYQPNRNQKATQAWILRNILDKLSISHHATAFVKKKGLISNTEPHVNNRYFLCIDLQDYFETIRFEQIYTLFSTIGYSPKVSWALSRLCTCADFLPQGGVTSPTLSNLVAFHMDRRISGYLAKKNISYTRYADDLTFSSPNPKALRRIYRTIEEIVTTEGFKINENKTRFTGPGIMTSVTGLIKDCSKAKFGIGQKRKRILRAMIHRQYSRSFLSPRTERVIEGWLAFLRSIDADSHLRMNSYFNKKRTEFVARTGISLPL